MHDQDTPPAVPAPDAGAPQPAEPAFPQTAYPPQGPPVYPAQPAYGYAPPADAAAPALRKRRAWIWWTLGIVALLAALSAAVIVPVVYLTKGDLGTAGFKDSVAVIYIDGVIAGTGDAYSGYITPEAFQDQLQQAIDDDSVKAILLRVDSPGGTVAASEEISAYVKACDKPVVVSIGDVGASGAYMVSSQADEIWAMPGSAVGSIGVISEIPNVAGLLDKVGVEFTVITAGKHKDTGSPYRPMTDEERALIQGSVNEAYAQFIDIVAEGRDMPRTKVERLATGWAWGGSEAKKLGLVDKLGTQEQALDAAARLGNIKGDYDTVTFEPEFSSPLDVLLGLASRFQGADALDNVGADMTRQSLPR